MAQWSRFESGLAHNRGTTDETQNMTLFGKPLHDLKLRDIQAFLDDADAEPLLWEAKATELQRNGVRKEVCGFANGHQPGYLILGAKWDKEKREWSLPGFEFPNDDPPAWVSSVVQQLQPEPLVDVRSIPVSDGHVAVVEVPPIGIPPCFHNGTVYERISGQTVPVNSPLRLSELYTRGDVARAGAERSALGGAIELMKDKGLDGYEEKHLRFALAVSATGHPPDISSRLFSPAYQEDLLRIVGDRVATLSGSQPFTPEYRYGFSQSNRWVNVKDPYGFATVHYWAVRVVWNGTAIVHFTTESNFVPPDQLAQTELKNSWLAAWELVEALGGYGPTYTAIRLDGGEAMTGTFGEPLVGVNIGRSLEAGPPMDDGFESVERELRRTTGEAVYEEPDETP